MTETMTRILREDETGRRFIVAGPRGAVECRTSLGGLPVLVDYHSPRPEFPGDEQSPDCDVLAGDCYCMAGANAEGLRLAWFAAGGDDEVIWSALEARYATWEAEG